MIASRFKEWGDISGREIFRGRLMISSWASEIGRAYLRWPGSADAGAEEVLDCCGMRSIEELRAEAENWVLSAKEVQNKYGIAITDLIYWELRVGRWNSAALNLMGQGGWWMTLYTCRDLIEAMMAIPPSERGFQGKKLYAEIIRALNSKLLERPINPLTIRERVYYLRRDIRHLFAAALINLRIYGIVKNLLRGRAGAGN